MPMRYGRVDTQTALQCPPEGNLPGAAAPFPNNEPDAATHLRTVFYRMVRKKNNPLSSTRANRRFNHAHGHAGLHNIPLHYCARRRLKCVRERGVDLDIARFAGV